MIKKFNKNFKKTSILAILFCTIFCSNVFATKKQESEYKNKNILDEIHDEEIKEIVLMFRRKKDYEKNEKSNKKEPNNELTYKEINYNKMKLKNMKNKIKNMKNKNMKKKQFSIYNEKKIYKKPNPIKSYILNHNNHLIYKNSDSCENWLCDYLKKFKTFQKLFMLSKQKFQNTQKNRINIEFLQNMAKEEKSNIKEKSNISNIKDVIKILKDSNKKEKKII